MHLCNRKNYKSFENKIDRNNEIIEIANNNTILVNIVGKLVVAA